MNLADCTRDDLIVEVTRTCLANLGPNLPANIADLKAALLEQINDNISIRNAALSLKDRVYKCIKCLPNSVIVEAVLHFKQLKNIHLNGGNYELAVYCDSGKNEGLYTIEQEEIRKVIKPYNWDMSERDFKEIIANLESRAPKLELTKNKDLIAVNNGVFDYSSKQLLRFSPEMVFLSKSRVNYNPKARNVTIKNPDMTDWDVDNWMNSLSDDPKIVHLLWEIIGACVRPNVNWKKSAWLYGEEGNGGKGTLCKLIRNICGEKSCASISVEDFGTDAFLEGLVSKSAIICDENDVGAYLDKAKKFKCAVTGDPISVNRKYRSTITFTFHGFIIQCINELPKVKDISGSFSRRLLIVPMEKCFTGQERPYIKDDYLVRDEVLEYVLYKVLNMNYYTLSEPEACRKLVAVYNESNNPVVEFWNEFASQFTWDLLPFRFLFDLYISWHNKFYPSGKPLGYNKFCREIRKAVHNDLDWEARENPVTTGTKIDKGEPLIGEYNLTDWQDHTYSGLDPDKKFRPNPLKTSYRGLVRVASIITCRGTEDDENGEEGR